MYTLDFRVRPTLSRPDNAMLMLGMRFTTCLVCKESLFKQVVIVPRRVELSLLVFYVTCNDISVIYVTAQM